MQHGAAATLESDMESWGLFTAQDGNELCRGLQLPTDRARKWAQQYTTDIWQAVELVAESEIRAACEEDRETDSEVFEPQEVV
jgi:hypothetical protein